MEEVKLNALVLRTSDYGENDKILTLLTCGRGKITAGIKGVRKAGAKLKFAAQPFCFAEYILTCRGGRYTVIRASENESFYDLRLNVSKFYAAASLCEAASALSEEEGEDDELFFKCINALRDMCTGDETTALISFLLAALRLGGYGIKVNEFCPFCGAELESAETLNFDMESGSFSCRGCSRGAGVSGATYAVLRSSEGAEGYTKTSEGAIRALKLLREYIFRKTEFSLKVLGEYIDLLKS